MSTPGGQRTEVDGGTVDTRAVDGWTVDTRAVDGWTIVVPVKGLDRAKSRLAPALPPADRRALVLAMAADVLAACAATPGVSRVRVVSSDPDVGELARRLGLQFRTEPATAPGRGGEDPLNRALAHAIGDVAGPVGVVTADLPELGPRDLARVLAAAAEHPHSVVPDHQGAGTTMAFWTGPGSPRVPRFGVDSAARHRSLGGAVVLADADPSGTAGRDVDTPDDLAALEGRAVGPATAAALRAPGAPHVARTPGVSATMVQ